MSQLDEKVLLEIGDLFEKLLIALKKKLYIFLAKNNNSLKTLDKDEELKLAVRSIGMIGTTGFWIRNGENNINQHIIFNLFSILDQILLDIGISDKEVTEFTMSIINKNIQAGLLDEKRTTVNQEAISTKEIIDTLKSPIILFEILKSRTYFETLCCITEQSFSNHKTSEDALNLVISKEYLSLERLKTTHKTIKTHYFDKMTNFDETDINIVIDSLKSLYVTDAMCQKIAKVLRRQYKANQKREATNENSHDEIKISKEPVKKQSSNISDKELKYINHELSLFYDFNEMKPLRILTDEEIAYCYCLMLKAEYKSETIAKVLMSIDKLAKATYKKPEELYKYYLRKFKYYEQTLPIEDKVKLLQDILNELEALKDDSDYEIWYNYFNDTLKEILSIINDNHEYELSFYKK